MKIIIVLFFIATFLGAKPVGEVVSVRGLAFLKKSNTKKFLKIKKGLKLNNGDLIKTTSKGRVKVIFNDNSIIFIARKSKIRIDKYDYNIFTKKRGAQLSLLSGRLKSWVAKLNSSKKKFTIKTPTAVIGVRGTQFIVSVSEGEDANTEVGVLEGKVEVQNLLDITKTAIMLTGNKYTKVFGTMPVMPGRDMEADYFKKMNEGFDIEDNFNFKIDFLKLYNKLGVRKALLSKTIFNKLKQSKEKRKENKKVDGKKGVNGRFIVPKVKIRFKGTIKGEK